MVAPASEVLIDPFGNLNQGSPVGAQYVSVHRPEMHSRADRTAVGKRHTWKFGEKLLIHVLMNQFDFLHQETVEIFHHITSLRVNGFDFSWPHLRDMYRSRLLETKRSADWIGINRPNKWNITPYNQVELNDFAQARMEIERAATALGFKINRQKGISLEGAQVNLMWSPTAVTSAASAPHPGLLPATPPAPLTAPPPGPLAALPQVPQHPPVPIPAPRSAIHAPVPRASNAGPPAQQRLKMVHRSDLGSVKSLHGFIASSTDVSNLFDHTTGSIAIRGTYARGGEAKRIHFNSTTTYDAYIADAMLCDARQCIRACSRAQGVSDAPLSIPGGEPFVHSVRDCFLLPGAELEFRPTESNNLMFCGKLPEVQSGVDVIFYDAFTGERVKILTTVCSWDSCEVCRPFLRDSDIAECKKREQGAQNNGQPSVKSSSSGPRPVSRREETAEEADAMQTNSMPPPFTMLETAAAAGSSMREGRIAVDRELEAEDGTRLCSPFTLEMESERTMEFGVHFLEKPLPLK